MDSVSLILENLAVSSMTLEILALAALLLWPKFYELATKYDIISIIAFSALGATFSISGTFAYGKFGGVADLIISALVAIILSGMAILAITGKIEPITDKATASRNLVPYKIRLIDKYFPNSRLKMAAYAVIMAIPLVIGIPLVQKFVETEFWTAVFTVGLIVAGNLLYSVLFWAKVDAGYQL